MESFLADIGHLLQNQPIIAYGAVFVGGIVSSASPCVLAVIPLVIGLVGGYAGGDRRKAVLYSLAFILGLSITFTVLGGLAALTGRLMGDIGQAWYWIVALLALVFGLNLMGILTLQVPMPNNYQPKVKGLPGALLLGLFFGAVSSPCATPVLAAILLFVASEGQVAYGMSLLFVYALAHCVLIFFAGVFTGFVEGFARARGVTAFSEWMKKAGSVLVVLAGGYIFYANVVVRWG